MSTFLFQIPNTTASSGSSSVVLLMQSPPHLAEPSTRGAQTLRQRRRHVATDARGQLAAAAVGGDADLEGSIGVGGQEGEGAEVGGIDDVDGDAFPPAEV